MTGNFYQRVYQIVPQIPKGKVATYGQIAGLIGSPRAARMVGWALHAIDTTGLDALPWQRVINREGRISTTCETHDCHEQAALLKKDGVAVTKRQGNYYIDLNQYLWDP
ncbi:MAG: MGMT family protein [Candidatus Kerfeldbacteria bacterium]|nr:MGMT family protein [Candidatus Kerfeldbacteria bacterium]